MFETHITLSKLDCARRQLECAIRLYFSFQDPISVHLLASAAHTLLRNLAKNQKVDVGELLLSNKYIRPEMQNDWYKLCHKSYNFFKHADNDPDENLKFYQDETLAIIADSYELYKKLTEESPPLLLLFRIWCNIVFKDYFYSHQLSDGQSDLTTRYTKDDRALFFVEWLPKVTAIKV